MKKELLPSILLTVFSLLFFSGIYSLVLWGIAQAAPNHGEGFVISINGKKYYENIAQAFKSDRYFQPRPSAVGYNAAGSGGSNKGPSNPDYLKSVQAAIDTFRVHNPGISESDIPSELVTASGSGLDPDLSPEGAKIQVNRISRLRNIPAKELIKLVDEHTEKPLLGLFGPSKVNVLKLNIALDALQKNN